MHELAAKIAEAAQAVGQRWSGIPRAGLILGTGLGSLVVQIEDQTIIPYAEIPHFPHSTVQSHAGQLVCGTLRGVPVVAMEGRFHFYEGYSMQQVTFPVRVMRALGAETLVVTNAAGGMNPQHALADVVIIEDHINLMGDNPLRGVNDDGLGPRFPDMCRPYTSELMDIARQAALELAIPAHKGVFVAVAGPNLETRAEYRMLRGMGADVVGMSTVPEVLVAVHAGMRVLGFSIVTDLCLPDALEPVDIGRILEVAARGGEQLARLIPRVFEQLPRRDVVRRLAEFAGIRAEEAASGCSSAVRPYMRNPGNESYISRFRAQLIYQESRFLTMFEKVSDADFVSGEHQCLVFWRDRRVFDRLRAQNAGKPAWSFLDGPITANNPMGVHHAWGRTYKDAYQRFHAMTGRELRYQNGFDCQGLWVEVEVERELGFASKDEIAEFGIDRFVNACKKRVLTFAARQTEQSMRLGFWMDWDDPDQLRKLAEEIGRGNPVSIRTPRGAEETATADELVARLGNPEWGGSYYTFSTENNETIWTFLKKCFQRQKVYRGNDVMPWSGRAGSAYSQMEVADGRRLTVHRSVFVRFPLADRENEYLLVWTTTPWTLTSNVAAAVNPDLDYVQLRTKRDDAVYYFAKDNLDYQRLGREFKEGFGRPEWAWPAGVPKLKTIGQIFKEQGGFEVEATLKGSELVGWRYQGPFDELPAQQQPGGVPEDERLSDRTGVGCHRVIDGGRDFKGNPHVVAGEGTGIVHIAPGCGDVDHELGREHGIVGIAPLGEDGRFVDGFGDFTGREAIDPQTAELVFQQLKDKHLLVSVEEYPHIYPHCWRTGDELVFRLVDEWFINMDWREEIKDVTRQIRWLPESIDGQERELEWLTNMRDWMISKKRFWGLALPIWVDEATGEFEVIGSLGELKDRAVEGWDELAGHTPHRPWIDRVKIRNPNTGNLMSRVQDVGNPWLDAGIVPFSTLQYNTNRDEWKKWYPADFVTECFPGQFRNWFYAMLSMATMMDHSPPFKTLLGHRLVMNEDGKPMHKSDGTAIWFEEAAEQLGVDTMRWLYLAQNPASDLRFGTRHKDRPVTLQTVDGPVDKTREGLPTCEVVSKPADEVRRQVLIPLWNSYAFFVNYAIPDEFDPSSAAVPLAERPEIDRWVLSNLQALTETCNREFREFNSAEVCRAATAFVDDLSNWYIRRNRRRFWRSRDAGDRDKLAAYQTLHHVLVTLTKLLAPCIPFLTERMYRNLVCSWDSSAVESVHLCAYPEPDAALLDPALNREMATAQLVVRLGHKLRDDANVRVRQPLAELRYACADPQQRAAIERLSEVIREELNVKQLTPCDNLDGLVSYAYKPNLKTLGPKYGKLLGVLRQKLPELAAELAPLRKGETVTVDIDGNEVTLLPEDVLVSTEQAADWVCTDDRGLQVAMSTALSDELKREGMARDFVRQVQQLRKEANLDIHDRIVIACSAEGGLQEMLAEWSDYIQRETLADRVDVGPAANAKTVTVGELKVQVGIARVG